MESVVDFYDGFLNNDSRGGRADAITVIPHHLTREVWLTLLNGLQSPYLKVTRNSHQQVRNDQTAPACFVCIASSSLLLCDCYFVVVIPASHSRSPRFESHTENGPTAGLCGSIKFFKNAGNVRLSQRMPWLFPKGFIVWSAMHNMSSWKESLSELMEN
jgi:hypothetical protein